MPDAPRRWVDDADDDPVDLLAPTYDPPGAARRLTRAAGLAVVGLLVAAAAALWSVLTYADRGPGDTVRHLPRPGAHCAGDGSCWTSSYTVHFLLRADLPIVLAGLLCAAPFIWWHVTVDRAARELGDGLDSPDWGPLGGWFLPVFNLKVPIVSIRELALVHGSDLAARAAIGWWGLGALGVGIDAIVLNAQHHSKDLDAIDRSGMAAGCSLAASALLAVVVVAGLTAAAKARLESPDVAADPT